MMMSENLDYYLRTENENELQHRQGHYTDYSKLQTYQSSHGETYYKFSVNSTSLHRAILDKKVLSDYYNLAVIKQDRYENVPAHIHDWLELCYVYSGSCHICIHSQSIILQQGEFILISPDTPHSLASCHQDDIVINILISKPYLNGTFFERLVQNNLVIEFFIEALNDKSVQDNYIYFPAKKKNRLADFTNQFLCEFYSPSVTSDALLDAQMTQIICELINVFQQNMELANTSENQIYSILKYIEKNYMNCTLVSTANFFCMHPNYLSAYIKKHTGSTYKSLIQNQKLNQTTILLSTTNMSVRDISAAVGYENINFLFKKFKEKYGCTPNEYRMSHS